MATQASKVAAAELYGLKNCDKNWGEMFAKYLISDLFTKFESESKMGTIWITNGGKGCTGHTVTYTDINGSSQIISITLSTLTFCAKKGTTPTPSDPCVFLASSSEGCGEMKSSILGELTQEDVDCLQGKLTQDLLKNCV